MQVPDTLVSMSSLRARAALSNRTEEDTEPSLREIITLFRILGDNGNPEMLQVIDHDFQTDGLTRYQAILCWTAPYSLASQCPDLVIRLSRYLMGETSQQEEAHVDWDKYRKQYPGL